jgi:hypothetical protein
VALRLNQEAQEPFAEDRNSLLIAVPSSGHPTQDFAFFFPESAAPSTEVGCRRISTARPLILVDFPLAPTERRPLTWKITPPGIGTFTLSLRSRPPRPTSALSPPALHTGRVRRALLFDKNASVCRLSREWGRSDEMSPFLCRRSSVA